MSILLASKGLLARGPLAPAWLVLAAWSVLTATAVQAGVTWPDEWKVFLPVDREAPLLSAANLAVIPGQIHVGHQTVAGQWVTAQGVRQMAGRDVALDHVQLDLAPMFGEVSAGNTAYVFLPLQSTEGGSAVLGLGADWWLQAWLNGDLILDTTETGNHAWPPGITDHTVQVDLQRGRNVLAVRFVSGSASSILALGGPGHMQAVQEAGVLRAAYPPNPDPVHGLDAFMERQGHKPYDLFTEDGGLRTLRVIFRDRAFGTPVWMLDHSPTVDHCVTASVWSAWNPTGSTLRLDGARPLGADMHRGWYLNADFSRLTPVSGGNPAVWSPDDPYVFYGPASPADHVARTNLRSGEQEVIASWERLDWPGAGKRIYGLTTDQRHIFVDLPNRGIFVPLDRDDDHPIPIQPLYDGRPMGPGPRSIGSNHHTVIYDHEEHGDMIALRTGMLIDRRTGKKTYIAAPLCGNTNYLHAFRDGRVHYPRGEEWNAYGLPWFADGVQLPTGMSLDELYDLWFNLPHATHGHESHSPDRQYIATDGGTTRIVRVRDYESRQLRLSPDGGNYHLHWHRHPRFFVAWVRGWHFGSYRRPVNANVEFQVFCDATAQPIVDTKHRFNGYYSGGDFSMLSPDATKIHYGSSMTGRFRNYIAVMARPRPPRNLSWRAGDGTVEITWEPSSYSRETLGYLVYRGARSGGPYTLLTPEPVTGTSWHDATVQPGTPYHYVVTSLEHAGLESGYSAEAARAGIGLRGSPDTQLMVYAEAEAAVRDLPTGALPGLAMGVDRLGASDWYYLYRHPKSNRGRAVTTVHVPADGRYHVWARLRSDPEQADGEQGQGQRAAADTGRGWQVEVGAQTLTVLTDSDRWVWVRATDDPVALSAGRTAIALATADVTAQLDLLCLATDADFVPAGPRPEERPAPPVPADLQAANVRERVNRLVWAPVADPEFSHYQVYACREPDFEPGQETLIGSPTYAAFIDWGLQADSRYHYAVTAVNRRGVESAAVRASAATPRRAAPEWRLELVFAAAELDGPFERAQAGGLRGPEYVVPEDPANNRVTWRVDIPRQGHYHFWLRHLRRGSGGRGDDVSQNVRVRIDGRHVTTLGGGGTDLNIPDRLIAETHPMASHLWTWAWPGGANLEPVALPAGPVELTLDSFPEGIRYDVLVITDEPSYVPQDGRLRQR